MLGCYIPPRGTVRLIALDHFGLEYGRVVSLVTLDGGGNAIAPVCTLNNMAGKERTHGSQ